MSFSDAHYSSMTDVGRGVFDAASAYLIALPLDGSCEDDEDLVWHRQKELDASLARYDGALREVEMSTSSLRDYLAQCQGYNEFKNEGWADAIVLLDSQYRCRKARLDETRQQNPHQKLPEKYLDAIVSAMTRPPEPRDFHDLGDKLDWLIRTWEDVRSRYLQAEPTAKRDVEYPCHGNEVDANRLKGELLKIQGEIMATGNRLASQLERIGDDSTSLLVLIEHYRGDGAASLTEDAKTETLLQIRRFGLKVGAVPTTNDLSPGESHRRSNGRQKVASERCMVTLLDFALLMDDDDIDAAKLTRNRWTSGGKTSGALKGLQATGHKVGREDTYWVDELLDHFQNSHLLADCEVPRFRAELIRIARERQSDKSSYTIS